MTLSSRWPIRETPQMRYDPPPPPPSWDVTLAEYAWKLRQQLKIPDGC